MTLLDKTFLTEDEDWNPAEHVASKIEKALKEIEWDTCNKEYAVTVVVREVER